MRPTPTLPPTTLLVAAMLLPAAVSAQEPYDYDANCRSWTSPTSDWPRLASATTSTGS